MAPARPPGRRTEEGIGKRECKKRVIFAAYPLPHNLCRRRAASVDQASLQSYRKTDAQTNGGQMRFEKAGAISGRRARAHLGQRPRQVQHAVRQPLALRTQLGRRGLGLRPVCGGGWFGLMVSRDSC